MESPFKTVRSGSFENGDIVWFPEGGLNVSYNCVDSWAYTHPDKVRISTIILPIDSRSALPLQRPLASASADSLSTAIIYEADGPGEGCEITHTQLLRGVCSMANGSKAMGIKQGDTVSDCKSRVLITSDEGRRGGRATVTKAIVNAALKVCPEVEHALVQRRTGNTVAWTKRRDKWWHEETPKVPNYYPPEVMSSEDPLFILYTSGSTGKPKVVVHTTARYLLGAALTVKYVFDVHPEDKFACMADVDWITGHTYIVYGPLLKGVTTTVFESTPVYPTPSRYWQVVEKHQITHFYTAPTAICLLRRPGEHHTQAHDLSTV
ncbi:acetyl-CoA synthetase [Thelephora terrestris]|uniref:acetate--CoA ligase n=1 Tax=Thelephora terrestris TaxID=56493 RepID=A0A9P6HLQ0_9AGAM|nr:acetyl-CoA synthetase [Thelephora terrestris]